MFWDISHVVRILNRYISLTELFVKTGFLMHAHHYCDHCLVNGVIVVAFGLLVCVV